MQELGVIKPSLLVSTFNTNRFPSHMMRRPGTQGEAKRYDAAMWMLTHDSKSTPLTRIAFVMTPLYELRPRQLNGLRIVTVHSPETAGRLWALQLMADGPTCCSWLIETRS